MIIVINTASTSNLAWGHRGSYQIMYVMWSTNNKQQILWCATVKPEMFEFISILWVLWFAQFSWIRIYFLPIGLKPLWRLLCQICRNPMLKNMGSLKFAKFKSLTYSWCYRWYKSNNYCIFHSIMQIIILPEEPDEGTPQVRNTIRRPHHILTYLQWLPYATCFIFCNLIVMRYILYN